MSSLTFTFVNNAGQTAEHTRTFNLATEDRFKAWLKDGPHAYWPVDENGDPLPETLANYGHAFDNYANTIMLATWSNVKRWEQQQAGSTAEAGVPDIGFD